LMVTGFVSSIAGYLFLGLLLNLTGFLVAAWLIGFGVGILMPTLQTMVNNLVTVYRRGAANATLTTAWDLGIGLGSLGLGYLSDVIGFDGMFLVCMMILVVALIHYLVHVRRFYRV